MSEQQPIKWAELLPEQKELPEQKDRIIHEKVMRGRFDLCSHQHGEFLLTCPECHASYEVNEPYRANIHAAIPSYTTSMDAIKLLRQYMSQRFPLLNLHLVVYTYNRCYAAFALDRPEESDEWSDGNGEYCMEDATCLAALRACGVVVE